MYRVLIVDDEPRHRMGLINMLKRLRPEYSVSEARNGADALEFLSKNTFDIIITDIKMPVMDGLRLIEQLNDQAEDIKVIILSAFGYFEYAQKAVNLGAFDYLLKPVDEEKFVAMLKKLENRIKQEDNEKLEKENLKKQISSTLPVYLELQLNKWITGNLKGSELHEIESIFPYKGIGTILASEIVNFKTLTARCSGEEINEIKQNIKYWMKEVLQPVGHTISFYLQDDKTILVTILNTSENFNLLSVENQMRLNDFIQNLKIGYGFDVIIGLGNQFDNIFDEVFNAFKQASSALEYKFFQRNKSVIAFSSMTCTPFKAMVIKSNEEDELTEALRKLDRDKSLKIFNAYLSRILSDGYPPISQFKDLVNRILLNVVGTFQNSMSKEKYEKYICDIPIIIKDSENVEDLKAVIEHELSYIIKELTFYRDKKSDIFFEKCLEYIEKHFNEDISLETVAEVFHFNHTYFSYLFKTKIGTNFSQYLLDIRLKKGKKLLKETENKIYEIALKIGFKDPKYFNRVFKKEFGITPDEYRRLL